MQLILGCERCHHLYSLQGKVGRGRLNCTACGFSRPVDFADVPEAQRATVRREPVRG